MSILKVVNIGPVKKAEISLDHKITIIAGRNGCGKSTTVKLLGLLLSGQDFGFFSPSGEKVLKGHATALLHTGTKDGSAIFGSETFTAKKGSYSVSSMAAALPIVCGQERWSAMANDRREAVLDALFGIKPTDDELQDLLRREGAPDSVLDTAQIDKMVTGLRQEWTAQTGERRYPESAAGSWLPPGGYSEEALSGDINTIKVDAAAAKDAFEAVKNDGWIDEDEMTRLRLIVARPIPNINDIEVAGQEIQTQIDALAGSVPTAPQQPPLHQLAYPRQPEPPAPLAKIESRCGHCGVVLGCGCAGEVREADRRERLAEDEQKRYATALTDYETEITRILKHNEKAMEQSALYRSATNEWEKSAKDHSLKMANLASRQTEIRQQYRDATHLAAARSEAVERLKTMGRGISKEQYRALEDASSRAASLFVSATAHQGAMTTYRKIEGLKLTKKLLLENDLKEDKKRVAVSKINLAINALTNNEAGQFGMNMALDVRHITDEGDIHTLLSTGMTLACDWLIQLAIGQMRGELAIIDGLDLLKAPYSNIVMAAIDRARCQVVVTFADNRRLTQENFADLDSGVAFYRMESGISAMEWESGEIYSDYAD